MTLTPEQKQAVASWVATGDNLSVVQKKLIEQFQITLTYRDVRFLVDDLNLELKDPAPKVDTTDVSKAAPARANAGGLPPRGAAAASSRKSPLDNPTESPEVGGDGSEQDNIAPQTAPEGFEDEALEDLPVDGSVTVDVDKVTLLPGALASGTVRFSDGVTGKWVVDQYGRPGFTEISQPGYRPTPADSQAFVQQLSAQLQRRGF
jgi:hypothetical protein